MGDMKKLLSLLTVPLLVVAVLFGTVSPASASTQHGCADNTVCLYQAEEYQQDIWHSSFYNFSLHTNGCINMSPATWSNGTPVNDNSAGIVINPTNAQTDLRVEWFDWVNCNDAGQTETVYAGGNSLTAIPAFGPAPDWRHRVTSIRVYVEA
jgi:hypothetical protein